MKTLRHCFLLITLLFVVMSLDVRGSSTTATSNGNWNSAGTWSNGIPTCGDTVFINPSVTVTITAHVNLDESSTPACSTAMFIYVEGTLHFNTGRKLYIPCGSAVYIENGGGLTKGSGGGSSNLIDVCGSTIWQAGDGSLSGPQWVGSGLPITLEFFNARNVSDGIQLHWATQSEINNDFFTIERSTDLENIQEIATIKGAGNSRERLEYREHDLNPPAGHVYYRLKQTDFDGAFVHSTWVSVKVDRAVETSISAFPTYVESNLSVRIDNALQQTGELRIYDAKGGLIYSERMDIISNAFVWTPPRNIHHSGLALIKVVVSGKEFSDRVIFSTSAN